MLYFAAVVLSAVGPKRSLKSNRFNFFAEKGRLLHEKMLTLRVPPRGKACNQVVQAEEGSLAGRHFSSPCDGADHFLQDLLKAALSKLLV